MYPHILYFSSYTIQTQDAAAACLTELEEARRVRGEVEKLVAEKERKVFMAQQQASALIEKKERENKRLLERAIDSAKKARFDWFWMPALL